MDCNGRPYVFNVVVSSNLFQVGDILSDLLPFVQNVEHTFGGVGPACTGIIGIAPSAGLNPSSKRNDNSSNSEWKPSLFEPVHGSAPDIAGKGIANPIGMIWAGQMILEHLGEKEAADAVMKAIENVLKEAKDAQLRGEDDLLTPDVNGKGTTEALGKAIENGMLKTKRS
ncbi:hypothetical protein BYT27DRAFT_7248266 [Phlegmacium glaucopus]|nr:hypothetical protein BYT27DRAFT_7248266 [Phlegmacium glaucopus]